MNKKNKPSKTNKKEKVTKKTKVQAKKKENLFKKFINFLKDVRKELGKVRWPSKKEMIKYASATLAFVIFFALFFLLADGIIWGLKQVMR